MLAFLLIRWKINYNCSAATNDVYEVLCCTSTVYYTQDKLVLTLASELWSASRESLLV